MVALSSIGELSKRIAQAYDPDKIILFGSYAYGEPREYSDVDLLVIMPFEGSSFRKALEIVRRVEPPFYADLIVRSSDEATRRYREHDPLIREAFDRGRVLYERTTSCGWIRCSEPYAPTGACRRMIWIS